MGPWTSERSHIEGDDVARKTYSLSQGEGSFYQSKSDGRWVGVIEAGWTERGTRRRVTVSSMDKDKAWDKLAAARKRISLGQAAAVNTLTVKAWSESWITQSREHMRPTSLAQHQTRIKRWVIPACGARRLDQLTPGDIRAVQTALVEADRSPDTRRAVHSTLMTMLRAAKAEGHQVPEPVLMVRRPPAGVQTRGAIPAEDALRLVAVAAQEPDAARWVAALLQGMRQGECLGLTWDAVDLDASTIDISWQLAQLKYADKRARTFALPPGFEARHLHGTMHLTRPKSAAGERRIPMVPWMRDALRAWREVAPDSPHGLVWPADSGRPRNATHDREAWRALLERAEVSRPDGSPYLLHEARHTAATLLALAGVRDEVRVAIMGHSQVEMTQGYTHVSEAQAREALSAAAGMLGIGDKPSPTPPAGAAAGVSDPRWSPLTP